VKLGFIPALVMIFLLRRISESNARRLLLSGELITATEAADIGLVNKVVPSSQLDGEVNKLAQLLITSNSTESMARTKQMLAEVQAMSLDQALDYAANMNAEMRSTDDFRKGVSSFVEKKKLIW
jgi:methylglutaconyl-CoA hydratase